MMAEATNELRAEYFWCHECGFFLEPFDGEAALAHILMHYAERGEVTK